MIPHWLRICETWQLLTDYNLFDARKQLNSNGPFHNFCVCFFHVVCKLVSSVLLGVFSQLAKICKTTYMLSENRLKKRGGSGETTRTISSTFNLFSFCFVFREGLYLQECGWNPEQLSSHTRHTAAPPALCFTDIWVETSNNTMMLYIQIIYTTLILWGTVHLFILLMWYIMRNLTVRLSKIRGRTNIEKDQEKKQMKRWEWYKYFENTMVNQNYETLGNNYFYGVSLVILYIFSLCSKCVYPKIDISHSTDIAKKSESIERRTNTLLFHGICWQ